MSDRISSSAQRSYTRVAPASFSAKYNSKREVWRFLSSEAGVHLPPYETVTIWHMRDLIAGKRRMIKTDEVRTINVPFFEGISIDSMLNWAAAQPQDVMQAFPIVQREVLKMPRAYIANTIYTITGDAFVKWIEKQVNSRNAKLQREADMIEIDTQIAEIYRASTAVSGKSTFDAKSLIIHIAPYSDERQWSTGPPRKCRQEKDQG